MKRQGTLVIIAIRSFFFFFKATANNNYKVNIGGVAKRGGMRVLDEKGHRRHQRTGAEAKGIPPPPVYSSKLNTKMKELNYKREKLNVKCVE